MTERFGDIRGMYRASFELHGDSPASLLTPKGRQDLRFGVLDPFVQRNGASLLDYGCGLGHLFDHLRSQGRDVNYCGIDMLPEFVQACRAKHGDLARFDLINPEEPPPEGHDIVFASGVFNLQSHADRRVSRDYTFARVEQLFRVAKTVLVCDFLSSLVDFEQAGAQHFSPDEIAQFCAGRLTRRFQIRHDLLPYEFTLIAWRDDEIQRPQNRYLHDRPERM